MTDDRMKCDGPGVQPCRGCRQSGSQCIFEARTRPKSLSVLPGRGPPFLPARPVTPSLAGPMGSGAPGFYPAGAQPAPPTLSRGSVAEPYALRPVREPMPPPQPTSLSVLTSPYPLAPPGSASARSPPVVSTRQPYPPPSRGGHARHESLGQSVIYHPQPPPPTSSGLMQPYPTPRPRSPARDTEGRLRSVESAVRTLSKIPSTLQQLQFSLNSLASTVDGISATVAPAAIAEVPETVWEDYRSRAWPLTPWLVGLRESSSLPGLVVDYLGRRSTVAKVENGRMIVEACAKAVKREIGRLMVQGGEWNRENIRALGVFA
jgi:hypothetical protein